MDISRHAARAAEAFARRPWVVLSLALVISVLAGWAILYLPVYTSRQALLPRDTDVVRRLDAFLTKFGAASDLILVLEGAPPDEMKTFAAELASALRNEPEIGRVDERLDTAFFLDHAYLLIPGRQLDQLGGLLKQASGRRAPSLEKLLSDAQGWMRDPPPLTGVSLQTAAEALTVAAGFFGEWERWLAADQTPGALDLAPTLASYGAAELARGDYASRDGRLLFVFVHPRDPSEDFSVRGPFIDKVKTVAATVATRVQASGRTPPTVGLAGLPAAEYEEYVDVQQDIILVVSSAAGFVGLLILLVVRSFRWALAIFVPMGLGALWSQALVLFTVGHLTIITSGFIAILFGLGADYGIFTASRIAEERRFGRPLVQAIGAGIGASFKAVLTAGGAALVIFGALSTVDFPGFAELGRVAAGGVALILVSTWTIQPAWYALLPPKLRGSFGGGLPTSATRWNRRGAFPVPVARSLVVIALAGAVAGAVAGGLAIPFDYDVLSLLPKDSRAAYYARRMVSESDYQSEVLIFTAKDMAEARRITHEAGRLDSIAKVQALTELFPEDADVRAEKARAIAAQLAPTAYADRLIEAERAGLPQPAFERLRAVLSDSLDLVDESEEQAFSAGHADLVRELERVRGKIVAIEALIGRDPNQARERSEAFLSALLRATRSGLDAVERWRMAAPLAPDTLPAGLRSRFFAADGTVAVYAFPAKSVYDPANLDHLMDQVYRVSPDATGFPATSQVFSRAVVKSFREGTVLAVVACLLWLMLALRDWRGFVLASLPLVIGGGWMLGAMALAGLSYNYANIIALPLVIALAVDYGVWFSHRWRELKDQTPLAVSIISGRVIALAAGTELAGLGAITMANYRGVSSLGVNITIGLLCCLFATLVVAPAIGQLIYPRRMQCRSAP